MKKIAIITPRFHPKINDGAEILAKLLALHLKKYYQIAVITTQAINYDTWENRIIKTHEIWENIDIWRFPVDFQRNLYDFNQLSHKLYQQKNNRASEEEEWIKHHGPFSSPLLNHIKKGGGNYDLFIFIGYLNAVTYFALPLVREKAFFLPLVHKEPPLRFKIFDRLFSLPKLIIANSRGEKETMTKRFFRLPPIFIIGINSDIATNIKSELRPDLSKPYILFIGRIELNKGVDQLFDYFIRFKKKYGLRLNLVLAGKKIDPIPAKKDIKYLGVVSEKEKVDLIRNSEFLVNSSYSESLSLTLIEAWSLKKTILVNGDCEVLKYQVIDSSGGIYYHNYQEFEKAVDWLLNNKRERKILEKNGMEYAKLNYSLDTIGKKFRIAIDNFLG